MSVYFVGAREVGLVKIGYAFNPVARYHTLRCASPIELTLEGAIPGGYDKEKELHLRFAKDRMRGEWFRLSPDLRALIDESTRPTKFTWAAVRVWLKQLAEADQEVERQTVPPEVAERIQEEIQERFDAAARRRGMTQLERLEADGLIHFPFRELAA